MKRAKRSTQVVLILSGSLLISGCDRRPRPQAMGGDFAGPAPVEYTNNTYVPGRGYYHANAGGWYPYAYNHFVPGMGYYSGGSYHTEPDRSPVTRSVPLASRVAPRTQTSARPATTSTSTKSSFSSTSRGGFGSSASSSAS
jgi:hypothetical protein